jgi:hypothetical protein
MKKRILLILAVGVAFSPTAFAEEITKSIQASTAGASYCKAGMSTKQYADEGNLNKGDRGENSDNKSGVADVKY